MESSIPEEIVYANDCDFITEKKRQKTKSMGKKKK